VTSKHAGNELGQRTVQTFNAKVSVGYALVFRKDGG
jgi:hypothetical protein